MYPVQKPLQQHLLNISDINLGTTNASTPRFLTLRSGLVCVGASENTTYRFSITDDVTSTRVIDINGVSFAQFDDPITVYEGTLLRVYSVDTSIKQRFIIDSPNIDSSTLRVFVSGDNYINLGRKYSMVDNILNINKNFRNISCTRSSR